MVITYNYPVLICVPELQWLSPISFRYMCAGVRTGMSCIFWLRVCITRSGYLLCPLGTCVQESQRVSPVSFGDVCAWGYKEYLLYPLSTCVHGVTTIILCLHSLSTCVHE